MNALRRHRIDAGLTITELAAKTGVSKTLISRVECGDGGMGPGNLKKCADYLATTLKREIHPSDLLNPKEPVA